MPLAQLNRESLVAALAARRLDRTLTTSLSLPELHDDQAIGATDISALDARLGGGFPRGQLSELVGPRSSGRTSVLVRTMAAATARGELVALVDALDVFDVESATAAGVDLDRLLWIRGHVVSSPGFCHDMNQRALEQALRALALVLQAGNFGLVALDVGEAPAQALRRLSFTTWLRLQRMVEGSQTMCVLVGNEPMARSAAGLTVSFERPAPVKERLRPRDAEDMEIRSGASASVRAGGGAPAPVKKEERLRPCESEDLEIRGRASASVRAGGGAPAPVKKEERLRPCESEDLEIRGRASALVRAGGGAPAPVSKEERLRPCESEDLEIRGRASASVRAGGGAPAPVKVRFTRMFEGLDVAARVIRARARHQEDGVVAFITKASPHV